jgi:hypothetical protein
MAAAAEATAAAEVQGMSGISDGVQSESGTADQQATAASGSAPASLAEVMLLLTQLIQTMPANIAAAVKVDKPFSHLDNA